MVARLEIITLIRVVFHRFNYTVNAGYKNTLGNREVCSYNQYKIQRYVYMSIGGCAPNTEKT